MRDKTEQITVKEADDYTDQLCIQSNVIICKDKFKLRTCWIKALRFGPVWSIAKYLNAYIITDNWAVLCALEESLSFSVGLQTM